MKTITREVAEQHLAEVLALYCNAKRKSTIINAIEELWTVYFTERNTWVSVYGFDNTTTVSCLKCFLSDLIDRILEKLDTLTYEEKEMEQIKDVEMGVSVELNFNEKYIHIFRKICNCIGTDYEVTNNDNIVIFDVTYSEYNLLSCTNKIQKH